MNISVIFLILLALFTVAIINITWYSHYLMAQYISNDEPLNQTVYDFIVVGSGSAGSVVAARLAEAGHEVLLVEAGGPSHFLQHVPAFAFNFLTSAYDWKYEMKGHEHSSKVFTDNMVRCPRGKVLGGSSVLNIVLYTRGHSGDFDEWSQMGNPGWDFERFIEPMFIKAENYREEDKNKLRKRGKNGPHHIESNNDNREFNGILEEAVKELGYEVGDVNGDLENEGFFDGTQLSTKNGWRMGTYLSYVQPLLDHQKVNLTVLTFAQATKVLISNSKRVYGVQVERFGKTLEYRAKKEVIVSAGAIGSPQLLMLSGIGPEKHLKEMNIEVKADLQVGQNLQDHVMVPFSFTIPNEDLLMPRFSLYNPVEWGKLILFGQGQMTSLASLIGFIHTKLNKDPVRPDIEIMGMPFHQDLDFGYGARDFFNYDWDTFNYLYEEGIAQGRRSFGLQPVLIRPKSVGEIRLKSSDYRDYPEIKPNYLKEKEDLDVLVEGVKFVYNFTTTKTFQDLKIEPQKVEGKHCGDFQPLSEEYWTCYVQHWSTNLFHPVGTCKMGPISSGGVVDETLSVRGDIKGLRVVDASIMPKIVGANTHAAAVVIGERGSELILDYWNNIEERKRRRQQKQEQGQEQSTDGRDEL